MKRIPLLILIICVITLFGCTSTETVHNGNLVTLTQDSGAASVEPFFVLKANKNEHINNMIFSRYASFLEDVLEEIGWKKTTYAKADVFFLLGYGKKVFYTDSTELKPTYNRDTNITEWVHRRERPESMVYVEIRALSGKAYRVSGEKDVRWSVSARNPDVKNASSDVVEELINMACEKIMERDR